MPSASGFFFSSRRRHTRLTCDWSSDVCSSDLRRTLLAAFAHRAGRALGVIDATALPREAERFVDALRTALRHAQLAGLVPIVHGLEAVVRSEERRVGKEGGCGGGRWLEQDKSW